MLGRTHLAQRPQVEVVEFGQIAGEPRYSVIIPLYGRIDFMEYQLAFFSQDPEIGTVEFIYVLDDPPRRREAEFLAASADEALWRRIQAAPIGSECRFRPGKQCRAQPSPWLLYHIFKF